MGSPTPSCMGLSMAMVVPTNHPATTLINRATTSLVHTIFGQTRIYSLGLQFASSIQFVFLPLFLLLLQMHNLSSTTCHKTGLSLVRVSMSAVPKLLAIVPSFWPQPVATVDMSRPHQEGKRLLLFLGQKPCLFQDWAELVWSSQGLFVPSFVFLEESHKWWHNPFINRFVSPVASAFKAIWYGALLIVFGGDEGWISPTKAVSFPIKQPSHWQALPRGLWDSWFGLRLFAEEVM